LESLLEYLRRTRGFDFTGYKRATLERRITKRLQIVGCAGYGDYLDYLEVHPDEFAFLFNTVLINVTSFFRDASSWEFLSESVLPDLFKRRQTPSGIRVWSAGCATGEEAYTLAMIFAEALGIEEFSERVKIYATDADDEALAKARLAIYDEREVAEIPPDLRAKYFEISDGKFAFRKDMRRQLIFGRHDLIQDAPISRVDLLVCRNTLMYFNAETQAKILQRFQFALNDNGVLFLGRAETLMTHTSMFAPLDLKRRISTKLPTPGSVRDRLLGLVQSNIVSDGSERASRIRELAFDTLATAQLVVDTTGTLVFSNERARALFGLSRTDVARPLNDLKISYRPVELRSAIDEMATERRQVVMRNIEWVSLSGEMRWLDVYVVPLVETAGGELLGASISFVDVTAVKRLQNDLDQTNEALQTAHEELQSTNEELETTNEELQSSVEELETTNEELQSTNEELETMNEELQSTNEELTAMNEDMRQRGDELNQVNTFLDCILTSLRGAVVVIDLDLNILVWNRGAENLWGLRESEVRGKHFLGLDIGLPVERLKQPIRQCINGAKERVDLRLEAVNRRGKGITCHIWASPLLSRADKIHGVVLSMEDENETTAGDGHTGRRSKTIAAD
jgi:two-component system CheB/CheR fusion protein